MIPLQYLTILFKILVFFGLANCTSLQADRAITTAQYFAPLTIGVIAVKSFSSNK